VRGGAPKISGVLFKILPDETVRLLELKKGNVHIVQNPITPAVLPWLEKQDGITVKKMTGTNVSYIGFNMKDEILKDKRVRLAIAHAIDRDSIIKYMLKGLAVKTGSLLSPMNAFYNESIKPVEYDPEKSKRLLDEAGYAQKEPGRPRFRLSYKTSKNPTRKKIAEIFARQLGEVGIEVEIKSYGIIYEAIEDVRAGMEGLLAPVEKEIFVGRALVKQPFRVTKVGTIAGSQVVRGKIVRTGIAKLIRDKQIVYTGKISSLKRIKDDAREIELAALPEKGRQHELRDLAVVLHQGSDARFR